MTLDEMMAELGKRWEFWPEDSVTSRAPNGMKFEVFHSCGHEVEGAKCLDPFSGPQDVAVAQIYSHIVRHFDGQGPIIYWRHRPELEKRPPSFRPPGYDCYARLVVGPKP